MDEQDERQCAEQAEKEELERDWQRDEQMIKEWELLCQRSEESFEKIFGEQK